MTTGQHLECAVLCIRVVECHPSRHEPFWLLCRLFPIRKVAMRREPAAARCALEIEFFGGACYVLAADEIAHRLDEARVFRDFSEVRVEMREGFESFQPIGIRRLPLDDDALGPELLEHGEAAHLHLLAAAVLACDELSAHALARSPRSRPPRRRS